MKELNLENIHYKDIENFLLNIAESTKDIQAETGELGLCLFQKIVSAHTDKIYTTKRKISSKIEVFDKPLNQFIKYDIPNGRTLTINHNPIYDLDKEQKIYIKK